jgi:hypothetical protein
MLWTPHSFFFTLSRALRVDTIANPSHGSSRNPLWLKKLEDDICEVDHSSVQKMDPSSLQDQVTYDDEFRLAIRAIPIREITLPVWEIAKSRGSHIVPVGRPPLNRRELLQYLGIIADFKRTTKYETPSYDILEVLAKSLTAWNWDANAQSEMLVLSNAVGLPFPPRGGEL